MFEELFTVCPLLSNVVFGWLPDYMEGGPESQRGENLEEIILFVAVAVILGFLYMALSFVSHSMNATTRGFSRAVRRAERYVFRY